MDDGCRIKLVTGSPPVEIQVTPMQMEETLEQTAQTHTSKAQKFVIVFLVVALIGTSLSIAVIKLKQDKCEIRQENNEHASLSQLSPLCENADRMTLDGIDMLWKVKQYAVLFGYNNPFIHYTIESRNPNSMVNLTVGGARFLANTSFAENGIIVRGNDSTTVCGRGFYYDVNAFDKSHIRHLVKVPECISDWTWNESGSERDEVFAKGPISCFLPPASDDQISELEKQIVDRIYRDLNLNVTFRLGSASQEIGQNVTVYQAVDNRLPSDYMAGLKKTAVVNVIGQTDEEVSHVVAKLEDALTNIWTNCTNV